MATEHKGNARWLITPRNNVSENIRRMMLAVVAIVLLGGVAALAVDIRFGIFATAFI